MIQNNYSLRNLNTFGLDVFTKYYLEFFGEEEVEGIIEKEFIRDFGSNILILGGGSNILFTENYPGLVIRPAISGIEYENVSNNRVLIRAGAGVIWDELVKSTVDEGLSGLENLSLIPGTVGASPIQNIGAYGVEVSSSVSKVNFIYLETGKRESVNADECRFGYRDSIFKNDLKNKTIILSVEFMLSREFKPVVEYGEIRSFLGPERPLTPLSVREAVIAIRRSKLPDPSEKGNAGSFFRNPVVPEDVYLALRGDHPEMPAYPSSDGCYKIPAGWLIEKSGWKGRQRGNAGVHDRQALVLVNHGGATGREIYDLSCSIREDVFSLFKINLETEVNII